MAAIMGRTEVGVKEFGQAVTIPNNPVARLMYYLDCICTVLDMSNTANLYRLRSFGQYHLLTEAEVDALLALCLLLSPDELNVKVIFQVATITGTLKMAAAVLGRTEVGVREFGRNVTVPDDPKAQLMYYLDCICHVLDMTGTPNLTRLRKYSQHRSLSEDETDTLVSLCFLLSPDELNGKVIFQDDELCGDSPNKFYEIQAVSRHFLVSESIVIGGQRRAVTKIMAFRKYWLDYSWVGPMQHFAPRLATIAASGLSALAGGRADRAPRAASAAPRPSRIAEPAPRPQSSRPSQPARDTAPPRSSSSSSDSSCTIL